MLGAATGKPQDTTVGVKRDDGVAQGTAVAGGVAKVSTDAGMLENVAKDGTLEGVATGLDVDGGLGDTEGMEDGTQEAMDTSGALESMGMREEGGAESGGMLEGVTAAGEMAATQGALEDVATGEDVLEGVVAGGVLEGVATGEGVLGVATDEDVLGVVTGVLEGVATGDGVATSDENGSGMETAPSEGASGDGVLGSSSPKLEESGGVVPDGSQSGRPGEALSVVEEVLQVSHLHGLCS